MTIAAICVAFLMSGCVTDEALPENQTSPAEESFAESVDYTIVGVEPGAGIMKNTEEFVMPEYGLDKSGWKLQKSSTPAMMAAVFGAEKNNEPIVAVVWEPHAIFAAANLRKLEDPKNLYNDPQATKAFLQEYAPDYADAKVASDVVASITYKGFEDDAPAAYEFLRRFNIPADTQSQWIYEYSINEREAAEVAAEYVAENREIIESWKPDGLDLGKTELSFAAPSWPGVTVKTQVVKIILEEMGYSVEVKNVDVGIAYVSVAEKEVDATLVGWLPLTHDDYWSKNIDELQIAGINCNTTWLGLAVPDYVDPQIRSLEDLI